MDNFLNDSETRLFDLLEQKDYGELSLEEQDFVARQCSMEDYILQRKLIVNAEGLYTSEEEPLPLSIPVKRKPVLMWSIPLYQAALAVAATMLIFFLLPDTSSGDAPKTEDPQPLKAKVEKESLPDTIIRYITSPQIIEKVIYDTVREVISGKTISEEPRILEASNQFVLPQLSREQLENRGSSLKEDNTSYLIPKEASAFY